MSLHKFISSLLLLSFLPWVMAGSGGAAFLCFEPDGCVQLEQSTGFSGPEPHEHGRADDLAAIEKQKNSPYESAHFDVPLWSLISDSRHIDHVVYWIPQVYVRYLSLSSSLLPSLTHIPLHFAVSHNPTLSAQQSIVLLQ